MNMQSPVATVIALWGQHDIRPHSNQQLVLQKMDNTADTDKYKGNMQVSLKV